MHAPSGYSNQRLGRDLAIKKGIEFLAEDYRKIAAGHCQVNGTKAVSELLNFRLGLQPSRTLDI